MIINLHPIKDALRKRRIDGVMCSGTACDNPARYEMGLMQGQILKTFYVCIPCLFSADTYGFDILEDDDDRS